MERLFFSSVTDGQPRKGRQRLFPCIQEETTIPYLMPKMKTNSGAKKRFKVTATGKIMRKKAFTSHILTKKSQKRKRNLRKQTLVDKADESRIKKLIRT